MYTEMTEQVYIKSVRNSIKKDDLLKKELYKDKKLDTIKSGFYANLPYKIICLSYEYVIIDFLRSHEDNNVLLCSPDKKH